MYRVETGDTACADVMRKKILNGKQREIWTDEVQLSSFVLASVDSQQCQRNE